MSDRSRSMPDELELDEEVWALLEGDLDTETAQEVEARVAGDPPLAARVAAIRRADAALRALPMRSPSEGMREALWQRVQLQSSRRAPLRSLPAFPSFPRRRSSTARVAAGTAGLAAAAAMLLWLAVERRPSGEREPAQAAVRERPRVEVFPKETGGEGSEEPEATLAGPPEDLPVPIAPEAADETTRLERRERTERVERTERTERTERVERTERLAEAPVEPPSGTSPTESLAETLPLENGAEDVERVESSAPSDEDLLLALDLELLLDLAVIENLELLEALGPLPEEEPG
ncbi:MAG: hypothetical protein ACX98W_01555 [bacterium]